MKRVMRRRPLAEKRSEDHSSFLANINLEKRNLHFVPSLYRCIHNFLVTNTNQSTNQLNSIKLNKMKFSCALATLFLASASAFAPAAFVTKNTQVATSSSALNG